MEKLTQRETKILEAIINAFIVSALPVSSGYIARNRQLGMSPATIRNVMVELERKGCIYQPHTSAGRIPTTKGYRVYVDRLLHPSRLNSEEKVAIRESLSRHRTDYDEVLKESSRILAHLSHQLSVITFPRIGNGIFQRMEIVKLSAERILIIITIQSGLVKTITLEIPSNVSAESLDLVTQVLNERLSGMKLTDIRNKFSEIVADIDDREEGLVRLFLDTADQIFNFDDNLEFQFTGTHNIVQQPEFADIKLFSAMVEILESERVIVPLIEEDEETQITIRIGEEIQEERMRRCSIISARYKVGTISGTLGIIGPMRMNYAKLIPLVDFTAGSLTSLFRVNTH